MSDRLDAPLYDAAAAAFEEFTFLFAEPAADDATGPEEAAAAIEFVGPLRGTLVVSVSGGLLPSIAANMLGQDQAPAPELQRDALGELANVICGSVLPALGGPSAVFSLGAPRVEPSRAALVDASRPPIATAALDLEGGRADVLWYVDAL